MSGTPSFARGVKFRHDAVRDAWVLLAPERLFLPEGTAVAILQLVDGARTSAEIAGILVERYGAPVTQVTTDVGALLDDLALKGAITWT